MSEVGSCGGGGGEGVEALMLGGSERVYIGTLLGAANLSPVIIDPCGSVDYFCCGMAVPEKYLYAYIYSY